MSRQFSEKWGFNTYVLNMARNMTELNSLYQSNMEDFLFLIGYQIDKNKVEVDMMKQQQKQNSLK